MRPRQQPLTHATLSCFQAVLAGFQGNFGEGECDSGVVTIAAKLKRK